ncbi:hypothetical protein M427DRAFT_57912 [Gonapodya prolifera JEL478]|uniref:Uncharacterized protein n=1 Tax=Gonapodya prolifera (strain JEL478) TaxID=1344416 RepID=A0A139ABG8_GONPJ|nr:hypothetical protein M427DRAFT_57912 [Gonapodya prolifera JEL478]|eukprot:KXS14146.1 hypothetical protein M427DRAFT_57912 [Gonapodya prolifera JEL478]
MKEPFPPMCGIRTFHIMVRIPDFQPEHLSDIDIEVATREVMELLPNLQRLTIKVRDKDYGGGSIKLLGTFFECAMRFAPPTCVIDIDEIELAVLPDYYEHIGLDDFNTRIYDRVLEVSKTDAWPENMRGWDGRDAVRLSNHHPRRMEFISLSDYDYVSINNY